MQTKSSRGFTLIELLVVIAIIGILAGITVTALVESRARGINASIKSNMRTMHQQIEMQYLEVFGGTYGTPHPITTPCDTPTPGSVFAESTLQQAVAEIKRKSGNTPICVSSATQWAVSTRLRTSENGMTYWCIETEGKSKGEAAPITGTFCL